METSSNLVQQGWAEHMNIGNYQIIVAVAMRAPLRYAPLFRAQSTIKTGTGSITRPSKRIRIVEQTVVPTVAYERCVPRGKRVVYTQAGIVLLVSPALPHQVIA